MCLNVSQAYVISVLRGGDFEGPGGDGGCSLFLFYFFFFSSPPLCFSLLLLFIILIHRIHLIHLSETEDETELIFIDLFIHFIFFLTLIK